MCMHLHVNVNVASVGVFVYLVFMFILNDLGFLDLLSLPISPAAPVNS